MKEFDVPILEWTARFADFNQIEYVWDMIGRNLERLLPHPTSINAIRRIWDNIDQQDMEHQILYMPRRVVECINNGGRAIHY